MELLHEGDLGASHVDLPDIELLVVVDAFVHLVGFEALRCAAIHDVGNLHSLARTGQFPNNGKDAIGGVGNARKNISIRTTNQRGC